VFDAYQVKAGRDKSLAIDFDHCTVKGSKEYVAGQPKSIAGYGDPVIVKGDGLYLYNVEWTPMGEKYARNYKDLSPAAVIDKQGVVLGLDSVALTPHGAVRDLNFFSSEGFTETMLKEMSTGTMNDKGASSAKSTSTGFVVKSALPNYNVDGANPAVRLTPGGPVLNPMVSDMGGSGGGTNMSMLDAKDDKIAELEDEIEHDEENPKCECASCKSANDLKMSGADVAKDKVTKPMSANNPSFPDAYRAQPLQYNTMNDTIIKSMSTDEVFKKMAAEVGMPSDGTSDSSLVARVMFAFLAKYEGLKGEVAGQINKKSNTEDGGLKQFSADIVAMKAEIDALKTQKAEDTKVYDQTEREQLVRQAGREGKLIPLSADEVKTVNLGLLKSIISNQPKNVVPIGSALRVLSVQGDNKPSREKATALFDAMVVK
jgi:phage I-like protein